MSQNKRFTRGEEIANSISHGVGAAFAVTALVLMMVASVRYGTVWHTVSFAVYGATLVLLYLSSTFNHSLRLGSRAKDFFHNFDQIAIFLLIAGTYTPLAITTRAIRHDWGWVIFGIEWGIALIGILIKVFVPNKFEKGVNVFYVIAYVIMGWLLLLFLFPLYRNIDPKAMLHIFIGGACYTLGVLFFKLDKIKYSHLVWHLLVIAGSVMHWVAIYGFVLVRK